MSRIEIKQVQKQSMVDQVEENLRSYIKQQGFKPGDTLPTENELAKSMNVSRNVIREALSRFKMLGQISSNKKNGIQLIKFDLFPALERVLDPTVMDKTTLHELFELRIMLEIGMAGSLFRNITPQQIQELKDMIVQFESTEISEKKKIDFEISFHSTLYRISRNKTLYGFQKYLKIVFDFVLDIEAKTDVSKIPPPKVTHMQLVECLESGMVEEFRKLMDDHFNIYFDLGIFRNKQE